jgi:hypothetical protein
MKFSNLEIENLSRARNHTIEFDGFDWWWYSCKKDKWELHCIRPFSDYKKALAYLKYWLVQYEKKVEDNNVQIERITDKIFDQVRIYDIVNSNKKTIDKIIDIYAIKPFATQVELSDYLNISKMAICKQLKKLKNG